MNLLIIIGLILVAIGSEIKEKKTGVKILIDWRVWVKWTIIVAGMNIYAHGI